MSLIKGKSTEEAPKVGLSNMVLPAYILLSAVFIIFVIYSYLQGVIYNSGTANGYQTGYQTAVVDLMTQVSEKCEPVALTAGEQQIDVINMACLQQAEATTEPTVPVAQ